MESVKFALVLDIE